MSIIGSSLVERLEEEKERLQLRLAASANPSYLGLVDFKTGAEEDLIRYIPLAWLV